MLPKCVCWRSRRRRRRRRKEEGRWKRKEGGASQGSDIFKEGPKFKSHLLLVVTFALSGMPNTS